jgi:hypothetical protein
MPESSTGHMPFFALVDALREEGCAFCTLVVHSLERYFDGLVYEKVNRTGLRDQIRSSLGFCAAHSEMLRQARSALGSAIIHRDLLTSLSRRLEQVEGTARSPAQRLIGLVRTQSPTAPRALAGTSTCPACLHAAGSEQVYIETLLANWHKDELRTAYQSSSGFCVPHLRATLARTTEPDIIEEIRETQLRIWQHLLAELDEFIRKHDHRFSGEPMGSERDAPQRSIKLVSGLWQAEGSRSR